MDENIAEKPLKKRTEVLMLENQSSLSGTENSLKYCTKGIEDMHYEANKPFVANKINALVLSEEFWIMKVKADESLYHAYKTISPRSRRLCWRT